MKANILPASLWVPWFLFCSSKTNPAAYRQHWIVKCSRLAERERERKRVAALTYFEMVDATAGAAAELKSIKFAH